MPGKMGLKTVVAGMGGILSQVGFIQRIKWFLKLSQVMSHLQQPRSLGGDFQVAGLSYVFNAWVPLSEPLHNGLRLSPGLTLCFLTDKQVFVSKNLM